MLPHVMETHQNDLRDQGISSYKTQQVIWEIITSAWKHINTLFIYNFSNYEGMTPFSIKQYAIKITSLQKAPCKFIEQNLINDELMKMENSTIYTWIVLNTALLLFSRLSVYIYIYILRDVNHQCFGL